MICCWPDALVTVIALNSRVFTWLHIFSLLYFQLTELHISMQIFLEEGSQIVFVITCSQPKISHHMCWNRSSLKGFDVRSYYKALLPSSGRAVPK